MVGTSKRTTPRLSPDESSGANRPNGVGKCLLTERPRLRARAGAGVAAHVGCPEPGDARGPGALRRVGYVERHAADIADLHLVSVAVLQRAEALVVGAHVEHVARLDRRYRGRPGDRLGDAVGEVACVVVGAQLAADPE